MILLIIAGVVSGIISGMGIGGGIILIPTLTMLLGFDQKTAQGITLLYFIPTAVFALIVHIKNKTINFKAAALLIAAGIPGAVLGTYVLKFVSPETLGKIFSAFLLSTGVYQIISGIKERKKSV